MWGSAIGSGSLEGLVQIMDVNNSSVAYSSPAPYVAKQDQSARQAATASAEADDNGISTAPVSQTDGREVEVDDGDGPEAAPVSESARSEDTRSGGDDDGGVDILV